MIEELSQFSKDVTREVILSRAEEESLYSAIASGCTRSKHQLINANLRIALKLANAYARNYPKLEKADLIGEANLGLSIAMENFAPEKGYRFSTYCEHWIKNRLELFCSDSTYPVRVPTKPVYALRKLRKHLTSLDKSFGQLTQAEKLKTCKELKVSPNALENLAHLLDYQSVDLYSEDGEILFDHVVDEELVDEGDFELLDARMAELDVEERAVIAVSFGLSRYGDNTYESLAGHCNKTATEIKELKRRALRRLKRSYSVGKNYQPELNPFIN